MKIYQETDASEFNFWSGAEDNMKIIRKNNKEEEFSHLAEEFFPEGCYETELNDWLWFSFDEIKSWLDIK